MSNLDDLEKRLGAAIDAVSAQNESLRQELAALKVQRQADLAELDALLARLKPLLEESENA